MKISEMIEVLKTELEKRGDAEIWLHSCYGRESNVLELTKDEYTVNVKSHEKLWFWTDLYDG